MKTTIILPILTLIFVLRGTCQKSAPYLFSGNHKVVNFTQQYSMETWFQQETGKNYLYFELLFRYPLPTFQQNLWLAVGFGTTTMDSADIVI